MDANFKLTVIEFTAFNSDGEKFFISDLSDEKGNGKIIIKDNETTVEDATKSLENVCNTVVIHKITEYDLAVVGKVETIMTPKFEPAKQLEHAIA
jgi:hypothetical protein